MFDIVRLTLAAPLATSGTLTVGYPALPATLVSAAVQRQKGSYSLGTGAHKLIADGNTYSAPTDFTVVFNANASNITVTWLNARTLPQGANVVISFQRRGQDDRRPVEARNPDLVVRAPLFAVDLGSPNALSTTAIAAAQAVAGAVNLVINGTLAANGVATNDVARGLQVVSAGAGDTTQTLTITGTNILGAAQVERIALNGTTPVFGKKAFKTVTQIAASAVTAGNISVGNSDVIGLPVPLATLGMIIKELQDGVLATAGVSVVADAAKPTAITGDTLGTYDPNSAANGSLGFVLLMAVPDPQFTGATPFVS